VRCEACGLEQLRNDANELVHWDFEEQQEKHYGKDAAFSSATLRGQFRRMARRRVRQIREFLDSGRLLEIGPGAGDVLIAAREAGYQIEAVEHSPALVEEIRARCDVVCRTGAFEELAIEPASFDAFLNFHVIEHVVDPIAHLRKAAEVVRPGGFAFIATPNAASWQQRLIGAWSPNYSTAHVRLYTPAALRKQLEQTGWEVVKVGTYDPGTAWPRVVTSMIRNLRGRKRGGQGTVIACGPQASMSVFLSVYGALSWPLRTLQAALGGGNELFGVARRREN
jgi:2-polyprenyl-3-methyl-5-hydroxy-6-metoxy-1,4-benzoquinol methylase